MPSIPTVENIDTYNQYFKWVYKYEFGMDYLLKTELL